MDNRKKPHTLEHRMKISISNKGKKKPHSLEWRKKVSETHKRNGLVPPSWKGKKRSPESVEKSASKRRGIKRPQTSGPNNPLWKGGISKNINEYKMKRGIAIREKMAGRKKPERCEICGVLGSDLKKGLCFDHNHATGEFRGWICGRCNTALGLVKDNPEILMAMINYLIKTINGLV